MQSIVGTWRLVRATATDLDGNPRPPPYGPKAMGRVTLDAEGRMMAVLCDGRAEMPAGQPRDYASYCGNYRFDGSRLVTSGSDGTVRVWRVGDGKCAHVLAGHNTRQQLLATTPKSLFVATSGEDVLVQL